VIVACVILVSVLYGFVRLRPARLQIVSLAKTTEAAEARLAKMQSPKEPTSDPGTLENGLREVEKTLAREQAQLDVLEKGLVAPDDPVAVYRLQVEVSEWAKRCGLHILEHGEDTQRARVASPNDGLPATPAPIIPSTRPRRRLRAETSYEDFRQFLRGLKDLSHNVTVVEYLLEPAKVSDAEPFYEDRLAVSMTLTL